MQRCEWNDQSLHCVCGDASVDELYSPRYILCCWHCTALAEDGIVPDTLLLGTPHAVQSKSSSLFMHIMLLSFIAAISTEGHLYPVGYLCSYQRKAAQLICRNLNYGLVP